tara:strand:+ start:134 stop:1027 length:894 start_codon:yes stop_codon:yes gene_type:complete
MELQMRKPEDFAHYFAELDRLKLHYVREGDPDRLTVFLLHGWPEYWYTFHRNIGTLAKHFDIIAPDLRGFGQSDDPAGIPEVSDFAFDILELADHLGIEQFGTIGHDIGAWMAQELGRHVPDRIVGLFFGSCINPGVGARWAEPDHHIEVWYQSFQRLPLAHELVGHNRDTVRLYFGHFLRHWSHDKEGRDADLEHFVDTYARPGRVKASFKWYEAWSEMRLLSSREGPPKLSKITSPARVFWGELDPPNKIEWRDNLANYFEDIDIHTVPDAGHFVHYDQPDLFNAEAIKFFKELE